MIFNFSAEFLCNGTRVMYVYTYIIFYFYLNVVHLLFVIPLIRGCSGITNSKSARHISRSTKSFFFKKALSTKIQQKN